MTISSLFKKRNRFTLVEAVIVLVMVGLIVAIIVGTGRIITNAKATSIVTDLSLYSNSVMLFQAQNEALPGDWDVASHYIQGEAFNGNGNGIIDLIEEDGDVKSTEAINAWNHLSATNFLLVPNICCTSALECDVINFNSGMHLPSSKISRTGYFIASERNSEGIFETYINLGGDIDHSGAMPNDAAISGKIARMVAQKFSGLQNPKTDNPIIRGKVGFFQNSPSTEYKDDEFYLLSYKIPL